MMQSGAGSLREELFRAIGHYTELSELARKGEADPMSHIGKIIKKRSPFLLLVIRDLIPRLERDEITYEQALFTVINAAQRYPDQEVLQDSRKEIQEIEKGNPAFTYAVKWLDSTENLKPSPREVESIRTTLRNLNTKYRERYAPKEEDTATIIPYFLPQENGESAETSLHRIAELVRRAILELHHLMVEHESSRSFFRFTKGARTEIENDLKRLAWFLFRCGYSVDRIASGHFRDLLTDLLNQKILDHLIETEGRVETMVGLSTHLSLMSLMDIGNIFEHPNDYHDLDDRRQVLQHVKFLKSKHRRGGELLKRFVTLDRLYDAQPQGRMARNFMHCIYYSAFQDYYGDHRSRDPRTDAAVELYKPLVDPAEMEKRAQEDLQKTGLTFSSKTQDEMAAILKLVMDSLNDPTKVRGKTVKILGDISSGAMGEVSIGIFKDQIVALKRVKTGVSSSLGDPIALLEYEGALNKRVQTPEQHPYVVEYYGMVEQDGEKLLINGYHPNDNLTQLVEKNWKEKYRPPFSVQSQINLATVELIFNQLLECLRVLKNKGVVHRDLKTDNILYMVDQDGAVNRIKIIDFGVGLALGPGAFDDMFRGKVVGTFSYMAPEQAKGKSVFQSDLYSMGAIMAVILTGRLPLVFPKTKNREDLVKQIARIEREPRPKLAALNSWLNKNKVLQLLAATVDRMLALDPFQRPDIEQVQKAFNRLFGHIGEEKHSLSIYYQRN